MQEDVLGQRARIQLMRKFYREGLLREEAYAVAAALLRPASVWREWASRMLLFWGSTLVLAGIVFFFAFNWDEMGSFLKLGLIEGGIILCLAGAIIKGITHLSGKVLLLAASVLVGVFLAVYGQIYQTGADAYELFAGWAFLILGWVVLSSFAAHWIFWLAVVSTAIILYWDQVARPHYAISLAWCCLGLAGLYALALGLREWGDLRRVNWLDGKWTRHLLFTAFQIALLIPTIAVIITEGRSHVNSGREIGEMVSAVLWTIISLASYHVYRFRSRDRFCLALITLSICIVLLTVVGKILFGNLEFDSALVFLFFALIITGVISAAVAFLRSTFRSMANEMGANDL